MLPLVSYIISCCYREQTTSHAYCSAMIAR